MVKVVLVVLETQGGGNQRQSLKFLLGSRELTDPAIDALFLSTKFCPHRLM